MSAKVLLTGATGFLGGYVIKEILEHPGLSVIAVGRNEKRGKDLEAISELVHFVRADLTDKDQLKTIYENEKPDYVHTVVAGAGGASHGLGL